MDERPRPHLRWKHGVRVDTHVAQVVARLGLGQYMTTLGKRPEKPLELYEFENSGEDVRRSRRVSTSGTVREWAL
ncbi:MAG TPA: hypothetical protein VEU33_50315 [Archangium sp.]|nr:hypothetical protein [Archangium sp.]